MNDIERIPNDARYIYDMKMLEKNYSKRAGLKKKDSMMYIHIS